MHFERRDEMITAEQAVQNVRDAVEAHQKFTDEQVVYDAQEQILWDAARSAKQALRDHIYATYGVSVFELSDLVQG